jgi:hypothetical protein
LVRVCHGDGDDDISIAITATDSARIRVVLRGDHGEKPSSVYRVRGNDPAFPFLVVSVLGCRDQDPVPPGRRTGIVTTLNDRIVITVPLDMTQRIDRVTILVVDIVASPTSQLPLVEIDFVDGRQLERPRRDDDKPWVCGSTGLATRPDRN